MPHDDSFIEPATFPSRLRLCAVAFGLLVGISATLHRAEARAASIPSRNETVTVAGNLAEIVGGSAARTVGANSSEEVGGSRTEVVVGDREEAVGGDDAVTIGGSSSLAVGTDLDAAVGGDVAAAVGKDVSLAVGGLMLVESADGIELRSGAAAIVLKRSGEIVLRGTKISVQSSGDLRLKGSTIRTN